MEQQEIKKKKSNYLSDKELLQRFGIVFENLKTQSEIKKELAEYGYSDQEIAKGKALYDKALQEYQKNIKETQEETSAYKAFDQYMQELITVFTTDRKKAKIIFKNQHDTIINLRLKGRIAQSISGIIDEANVFYSTLAQNNSLLTQLSRLKVNEDHINSQIKKIAKVEKAYADYTKEKGESQQATKDKNKAIKEIEQWVKEFHSIAAIALEDKPQLLESVAKFVRS